MTDPVGCDLDAIPTLADDFDGLSTATAIHICSIREAAGTLQRPLAQVQQMSGAHLLGQAFSTAAGVTYYLNSYIDDLARAPRLLKDALLRALQPNFPEVPVVILRQSSPRAEQNPERSWYGYDRLADRSVDPRKRRAQDNASRMYWPVTQNHRELVNEAAAAGLTIPLIISVGGWIASCREITGIDHALTAAHGHRVAFTVRPADDWAANITDRWLNSGAGKSILWWHQS